MTVRDERKPLLLVTGSSGLIGSAVMEEFTRDFRVVGMDVKEPDGHAAADHIPCDLTDDVAVERAFRELRSRHGSAIASVIHLAAYYDFSGADSPLYETLTVEGTRRLLRALAPFDAEQLVFSSTLLVMEPAHDDGDGVITETSPVQDDPWNYPRSKLETEQVLRAEHGDLPVVVLRIAGVYDDAGHSIPIAHHIARIREKQLESVLFPGHRDHGQPFVHRDDLVDCFRRVVERRHDLDGFEVFLIAEPEVATHEALQETIGTEVHGHAWPTVRIPAAVAKAGAWLREKLPGGEDRFIRPWMVDVADDDYPVAIDRARERLGWRPHHRLLDTIPSMVRRLEEDPAAWYEENGMEAPESARTGHSGG